MAGYEQSFLAVAHQLLREREQMVCTHRTELIAEMNVALNLLFALPLLGHGVHQEDRLGVTCVMHLTKAANDYLAALDLISESLHAQAANAARAGFETACQCAWLHIKRDRLDPWWNDAAALNTKQIRADLPRADFRHFIYAELCEVAHPRRRSMEFLVTRSSDSGTSPSVGLVPPYDPDAVHHTQRAIYLCSVCSLWDFEFLHEPAMSSEQRASWNSGFEPIRQYYEAQIVPPVATMAQRPIDQHAIRIPQNSGLLPCLYIPVAARDISAIETYVGTIVAHLARRSPSSALLVEAYKPEEADLRLPIWGLREAAVLHYPRQVWVHVDYGAYRHAYSRAFPDVALAGLVLDHVMNRRVARLKGFTYLRIVPISRPANSSHGGLSEGWGVKYHSSPRMMELNRASQAVVQYADLSDIVKMLNMEGGGSFMDTVNEAQKLVALPKAPCA